MFGGGVPNLHLSKQSFYDTRKEKYIYYIDRSIRILHPFQRVFQRGILKCLQNINPKLSATRSLHQRLHIFPLIPVRCWLLLWDLIPRRRSCAFWTKLLNHNSNLLTSVGVLQYDQSHNETCCKNTLNLTTCHISVRKSQKHKQIMYDEKCNPA